MKKKRRLMVKRLESSFGAFKSSLQRFLEFHKNALHFINKTGKFFLNREIIEEIILLEDDEIIQKKLEEYENFYKQEKSISKYHEFYIITKMERGNDFIEDVQSDIRLFEKLLQKFDDLNLQLRDPKVEKLFETISHFLDRKIKEVFGKQVLCAYGNITSSILKAVCMRKLI